MQKVNGPKDVTVEALKQLDLRHACLPLGVRLESKEKDQRWLALDKEDWRMLRMVLRTKLAGPGNGYTPADMSSALCKVANFADAAVAWYEKENVEARPEDSGAGEST